MLNSAEEVTNIAYGSILLSDKEFIVAHNDFATSRIVHRYFLHSDFRLQGFHIDTINMDNIFWASEIRKLLLNINQC